MSGAFEEMAKTVKKTTEAASESISRMAEDGKQSMIDRIQPNLDVLGESFDEVRRKVRELTKGGMSLYQAWLRVAEDLDQRVVEHWDNVWDVVKNGAKETKQVVIQTHQEMMAAISGHTGDWAGSLGSGSAVAGPGSGLGAIFGAEDKARAALAVNVDYWKDVLGNTEIGSPTFDSVSRQLASAEGKLTRHDNIKKHLNFEKMGFAQGGFVGGPEGSARLAVVHGGELVLNRQQQRSGIGGITVNITGNHITGEMELDRLVRRAITSAGVRGAL
tara:strand:- start:363 stop:1184 length:822 start_codon:yes stop_codon:yes gene_type:complete